MGNDLEQEILTEIDNTQGQEDAQAAQPQNATSDETSNNEDVNKTVETELWKEANEFKNGMWKTPDDMYKSIQYYQQRFTPFEQTLQKYGYQNPQDFEQVLGLLPDYQKSYQMINNLHTLMSDPELSKPLEDAFKQIKRQQEIKNFGYATDELPPHIQKELSEMRELKKEYEQDKLDRQTQADTQEITNQVNEIQKLCETYKFDFDLSAFVQQCMANDIPPKYIKGYFMDNFFSQIVQNATNTASLNAVNQNKKVQDGSISTSTKTGAKVDDTPKTSKDLKNSILKLFD